MPSGPDIVVGANRLPVHRVGRGEGKHWEASPGGLASALTTVLKGRRIAWIGWTGRPHDAPKPFVHEGIANHPVQLSRAEVDDHYRNFSNRTLWPLYHDGLRTPVYRRAWWGPHAQVNRRFAARLTEILPRKGTAWIHDYHLQLVPGMVREMRPDARISFFLHIPMPAAEMFARLPWRRQILEGLLGADLVGFQTPYGAQNFVRHAARFTDARALKGGLEFRGRTVRVEAIPISIDVERFRQLAFSEAVEKERSLLREQLGPGRQVLLGVDRLDYTKGIDVRLRALETLLRRRPELVDRVVLVQIAVPSRERVPEYEEERARIEQMVGHINGTFGNPGRMPVHFLCRSLPKEKLVAYYSAADVMLVTPLRDGMNLVAKEYVASHVQGDGALVLSEFAGAAVEFRRALQVNPHDIDGLADVLERALEMKTQERRRRMSALRRSLERNDVFLWARRCLDV